MRGMQSNHQMLRNLKKMQRDMEEMQKELEAVEVEGSAGGAVKIRMNGQKQVLAVQLEPAAVDPENVSMLEDLCKVAFNDAVGKIEEESEKRLGKATAGLNMPGMPGLF